MIDAKKLNHTIEELEKHAKEMGETSTTYKNLSDLGMQIDQTNERIRDNLDRLNAIGEQGHEQIIKNEAYAQYLEQWQLKMTQLSEVSLLIKKDLEKNNGHIVTNNKYTTEVIKEINQLKQEMSETIGSIPGQIQPIGEEIKQDVRESLNRLQAEMKNKLSDTVNQLEVRITQFVSMQIELNKGITTNMQTLEKTMQKILDNQQQQNQAIQEYKVDTNKKIEVLTKLAWVGVCAIVVVLAVVGVGLF